MRFFTSFRMTGGVGGKMTWGGGRMTRGEGKNDRRTVCHWQTRACDKSPAKKSDVETGRRHCELAKPSREPDSVRINDFVIISLRSNPEANAYVWIASSFLLAMTMYLYLYNMIDMTLPATDYPLPTTSYQLPTTSYRLPATDYRLPTTDYQLPTTSYRLPTNHFILNLALSSTLAGRRS